MDKTKYKVCYLSEIGHKNFWYPTNTNALFSIECDYEKLNWVSGAHSKLRAIKILRSCILPLNINGKTADNLSPPQGDAYTVVWINK